MDELRLYDYAASANCLKVRLVLAQLARDYERVPVDIFAGETLTEDFAARNPARSTPVLEVRGRGFLTESNAILLYLAEGTPLLPHDAFERAQVARWLLYEQADVVPTMGGLRFRLLTGRIEPDGAEARSRHAGALTTLAVLESHLDGREFFVGAGYTVADAGLYGYVHVADEAGVDTPAFPRVEAWLRRVESTPRFVNDLEPYPANARPGRSVSIYD
jgi:glutathione S-transferase